MVSNLARTFCVLFIGLYHFSGSVFFFEHGYIIVDLLFVCSGYLFKNGVSIPFLKRRYLGLFTINLIVNTLALIAYFVDGRLTATSGCVGYSIYGYLSNVLLLSSFINCDNTWNYVSWFIASDIVGLFFLASLALLGYRWLSGAVALIIYVFLFWQFESLNLVDSFGILRGIGGFCLGAFLADRASIGILSAGNKYIQSIFVVAFICIVSGFVNDIVVLLSLSAVVVLFPVEEKKCNKLVGWRVSLAAYIIYHPVIIKFGHLMFDKSSFIGLVAFIVSSVFVIALHFWLIQMKFNLVVGGRS